MITTQFLKSCPCDRSGMLMCWCEPNWVLMWTQVGSNHSTKLVCCCDLGEAALFSHIQATAVTNVTIPFFLECLIAWSFERWSWYWKDGTRIQVLVQVVEEWTPRTHRQQASKVFIKGKQTAPRVAVRWEKRPPVLCCPTGVPIS